MTKIQELALAMIDYDNGDPKRIQHTTKVHAYASLIGRCEGLNEETQFILESAALVHDMGIRASEKKYGHQDGKLQEKEGPDIAQKMLSELGFENAVSDRVQYLIAHHHTYTDIDSIDYQILVEADFLVNMHEDCLSADAIESAYNKIFKTESGKKICREMFGV